jgi:predicted  nucleic acid-binding Zn-ribbon protein
MADQVMAYCVKEKAQKPMNDPKEVTLKNGKLAVQGVCSSCGTKMMKFISSKKPAGTEAVAEKAVAEKAEPAQVATPAPHKEHVTVA